MRIHVEDPGHPWRSVRRDGQLLTDDNRPIYEGLPVGYCTCDGNRFAVLPKRPPIWPGIETLEASGVVAIVEVSESEVPEVIAEFRGKLTPECAVAVAAVGAVDFGLTACLPTECVVIFGDARHAVTLTFIDEEDEWVVEPREG